MERGQVDLFGGDELIIGIFAEVLDEIDDEGIGQGVLCQKDNLRSSCR